MVALLLFRKKGKHRKSEGALRREARNQIRSNGIEPFSKSLFRGFFEKGSISLVSSLTLVH
jgi:hypothetical protein